MQFLPITDVPKLYGIPASYVEELIKQGQLNVNLVLFPMIPVIDLTKYCDLCNLQKPGAASLNQLAYDSDHEKSFSFPRRRMRKKNIDKPLLGNFGLDDEICTYLSEQGITTLRDLLEYISKKGFLNLLYGSKWDHKVTLQIMYQLLYLGIYQIEVNSPLDKSLHLNKEKKKSP